jgi:hypothetical protein
MQPVAVNMPDQLPPVVMPVVITVDPASMKRFSEELTAVVTAAVRSGYATALEDIEFEADEADNYENPPQQLNEVLQEFISDNRELLERLGRMSGGPVSTDPPPGGGQ